MRPDSTVGALAHDHQPSDDELAERAQEDLGPRVPEQQQISMIDTSRAYLNAKTSEDDPVYVDSLLSLELQLAHAGC